MGRPTADQQTASVRRVYKKRKVRNALSRKEKKQVKSMISTAITSQAEKKYFLASNTQSPDWSGAGPQGLCDVTQGVTDTTRVGDSFYLRSIRVQGDVSVADTTNIIRVLVFQWFTSSTDDPPSPDQILQSFNFGSVQAPHTPYHHDQRTNFSILYDRKFNLTSTNGQILFDTGYLKPKKRKVYMDAGGANGNNKVYIMSISDSAAATHPLVVYASRVTFNDL